MARASRAIAVSCGLALVGAGYLNVRAARLPDLRTAGSHGAARSAVPPPPFPAAALQSASSPRAVIDKYCVGCHNARLRTAGLMMDQLDVERVGDAADVWEKVVRKLRMQAMPPPGLPRPDPAASKAMVAWLETSLDRAAAANPNPGRTALHRLNRAEYANAVRDLLALEIDGRSLLPADDADEHGFDNVADVLTVSPALLERYLSAAHKISRLALGRPPGPVVETYNVPRMLSQDDRLSDDLPFGSRGGAAIRHYFPADGDYVVTIRLQTNLYDYIRGLGEPHTLEVRLDGVRIEQFTVGGDDTVAPPPPTFAGTLNGNDAWETYAHEADAELEARVPVKAGLRVLGISFVNKPFAPEGVLQPRQVGYPLAIDEMFDGKPAIDSIAVGGPYAVSGPGDTASRRRILTCWPAGPADEEPCAKSILSTLARRAYRRPVTEQDLRTLLGFYAAGRAEGTFEAGVHFALERILIDPDFLFRVEHDPPDARRGSVYRISDVELASRLSFFLWSSIPDDELLEEAVRGRLESPPVLEQQVRRMLADPRAKALVDNFAGQWLVLRNIREVTPDPDLFPDFDENLREAFLRETELFIETQLREDRSVVELLSANYTFVNERLARHYGIRDVHGDRFRRVTLADNRRGGLLGHGSLLTVTSYPNRTSPVLRGKWLLETILGTPPPPPPPDVPALREKGEDGRPESVRERLEAHRKNPACASCHAQLDPLGFALEEFDAIGAWRATDAGTPIDASGMLPGGAKFQGLAGLRAILLSRQEQFVQTITEKLLAYALGRSVEHYDMPVVRTIARDAAARDYRWSSIVLGIVKSIPFQMRRSES